MKDTVKFNMLAAGFGVLVIIVLFTLSLAIKTYNMTVAAFTSCKSKEDVSEKFSRINKDSDVERVKSNRSDLVGRS